MIPLHFCSIIILAYGFFVGSANANIGDAFGFGAQTAALAGAKVGAEADAYSAYSNPAALAGNAHSKFELSWSILDMVPSFLPIENVVVENGYTSDRLTIGNVDTKYRATFGYALGARWNLFPDWANLSLGGVVYLPGDQIGYLDSGENFVPEYVLYRSRTQRPQVEVALAGRPAPWIKLGTGMHFGFGLTSSATVFLQTLKDHPSTMRFAASLQPKAAPYFGVQIHPHSEIPLEWGSVVRLPLSASNTMALKSGARALGSYASLDFNFTSNSVMFYDPLSIENGLTFEYFKGSKIYLQADFQGWSKYPSSVLVISDPKAENCGNGGCGLPLSAGVYPGMNVQDIWVVRAGNEFTFGDWKARVGYSYRPSILKQQALNPGNVLDPAKNIFALGFGYQWNKLALDLFGSYQQMITQNITKSKGDENAAGTGDLKIGAPGYQAGGKVIGGGISLTWSL